MLCSCYSTSTDWRDEDRWQQIYAWAKVGKLASQEFKGRNLLTSIGYHKHFIFDSPSKSVTPLLRVNIL